MHSFWLKDADFMIGEVYQTDLGDWAFHCDVTKRTLDLFPNFHKALDALIEHYSNETKEENDENDCPYGGAGPSCDALCRQG